MMQILGFRGGSAASSSSPKGRDASPRSDHPNPSRSAVTSSSPVSSITPGSVGPARPLRLVYCDEKGKFRMDPEAVAALHLVKGPIGVVSVCGRARQGKSFILNQVSSSSSSSFSTFLSICVIFLFLGLFLFIFLS